ncbi:ankyrin repeat domain-containing protein [Amycolatopsis suaedae]|uniref:Ankyrin repeat domain-containing protein n=1 Tax=Amycolatopsis suaedae TaxID=2510978 RepID=A0A4Q7JBR6_9PSEU|nr:ankyrin repeat domain-containing protein [Amycolatopsis suaedae]RZQ64538.1 ankyrin repeat domain-containing protein [Amycolatopsis suaedae]
MNLSSEQLRKRAKDLLRSHRAGAPEALDRVAATHPAPSDPLKLTEAQFVLARELGFPSWPKLTAYVYRIERHGPGLQHAYHDDLDYYTGRAHGLLASALDGTESATAAFERWSKPMTRAGARAVVAAEHGFGGWRELRRHVRELTASGEPFAKAYRAVEDRDVDGLAELVDRFPELVGLRGTNGNDLLGMAGATCDERLVRVLLDRGADPASANAHGWTSLHQAAYSDLPELARMLLDAGAPVSVSARGDGGTPLVVALFWGNRRVAELLAEIDLAPGNLRVAAGLGRLDLIEHLLSRPAVAGAHREFYRPHSGFPFWRPDSADVAEVRDEALSWAARNDRADAVRLLARRGARVEADVYRGTALTWAAASGAVAAVRALLEVGADVNQLGTFGGPDHGEGVTALHLAAQSGHLDVVRVLLDAGADPSIVDALHEGDAESWAEYGGHPEVAALLTA